MTLSCEDCGIPIDVISYRTLATNELYKDDEYFIIHRSCVDGDEIIDECGDLVLVHSRYVETNE